MLFTMHETKHDELNYLKYNRFANALCSIIKPNDYYSESETKNINDSNKERSLHLSMFLKFIAFLSTSTCD